MSKATMPEPVGFITDESFCGIKTGRTNCKGAVPIHQKESRVAKTPLFTDDQLEAYTTAKVREALEEAAKVAESCVCSCCCSDDQQFTAQDAAHRIRALIPSTPA